MNFHEACAWLDEHQFFKIKLGLETTCSLLAELGNPQEKLAIIHIAGTNGKGSVGATLLSLLTAGGYRTGFYSSPHLSSVRERFRIGQQLISEDEFTLLIERLANFLVDRPHPTYFELTTILALLWFAEQGAEAVILETGMGGRLDATNVVRPLVSIITDISLDHQQYLGQTIAAIAGEKAGIIKPGVPVIFSGAEAGALPVIDQRCHDRGSPLLLLGRDFRAQPAAGGLRFTDLSGVEHTYPLSLRGDHQVRNTALALAALERLASHWPLSEKQIRTGLAQVRWPGRMELLHVARPGKSVSVLLDGAHNAAGVARLCQSLGEGFPRRRLLLIWGKMADKELGSAFTALLSLVDLLFLTRAESERSASPQELLASLPAQLQAKCRCVEPAAQALELALHLAEEGDLICVAGSLYLVGAIRPLLVEEGE
jgi:dihydrofolate synthase/folylpolyglutamate synthase